MSWLSNLFSGVGDVINGADKIISRFQMSPEEKAKLKLELEQLLLKREAQLEESIQTELTSKERILVAELQQSDAYTKRARPTVVYAGIAFIFLNYCLVPAIQSLSGADVKAFDLPTEFWVAWGGIVSTWVVGRSAEKRGMQSKAVSMITGSKPTPSLFDDAKG